MDTPHIRQTANSPAEGVPFAGLGHSLTPVRLRARLLVPVFAVLRCQTTQSEHWPEPQRPAGFRLLVRLGREIRGR
ncbi:hypothetical protein [Oleidesulfovibrio sp.]|uniref:hypothetical protein n=1 Tax=Oleidesulfovibrio sp. TaxID=2909707 RepID=UPI003A8BC3D2